MACNGIEPRPDNNYWSYGCRRLQDQWGWKHKECDQEERSKNSDIAHTHTQHTCKGEVVLALRPSKVAEKVVLVVAAAAREAIDDSGECSLALSDSG